MKFVLGVCICNLLVPILLFSVDFQKNIMRFVMSEFREKRNATASAETGLPTLQQQTSNAAETSSESLFAKEALLEQPKIFPALPEASLPTRPDRQNPNAAKNSSEIRPVSVVTSLPILQQQNPSAAEIHSDAIPVSVSAQTSLPTLPEQQNPNATNTSSQTLSMSAEAMLAKSTLPALIAQRNYSEMSLQCGSTFPPFHWGWHQACHQIKQLDEACELFFKSSMYNNPLGSLEVAMRSWDSAYKPSTRLLKRRMVQARHLAHRPFTILALGPSVTLGRGCIPKALRWTDALQNLSNFTGSRLPLRVINEARPASPLKTQWRRVLWPYRNITIDLLVIDYAVTATDTAGNRRSAVLLHAFVNSWPRPPAILFLETATSLVMTAIASGVSMCNIANDFENWDLFYTVSKKLRLPLLSYPDFACQMPAFNRTSESLNGLPYFHSYKGIGNNVAVHYGCGVHLILAQMLHLYLNKMFQDSCAGDSEHRCISTGTSASCAGFNKTLEMEDRMEEVSTLNLSREEDCELHVTTSWAFIGEAGLPAFVGNRSKWQLGADRPGKFGWIANEEPKLRPGKGQLTFHSKLQPRIQEFPIYGQLESQDIIFLVQLSLGLVFVEYLSTYQNIGSARCRLEDLKGVTLTDWLEIDAQWSQRMSIASRVTLAAPRKLQLPKVRGFNSAVRCQEQGKKFKIIAISSC